MGNTDFTTPDIQDKIKGVLGDRPVHTVLSDMAPNASGVAAIDNEQILDLCYRVLRLAVTMSAVDGTVLMKLWHCGETQKLQDAIAKFYTSVKVVKPNSSRDSSAEIFLLGRKFKGLKQS